MIDYFNAGAVKQTFDTYRVMPCSLQMCVAAAAVAVDAFSA
jgi:hypothetical protein